MLDALMARKDLSSRAFSAYEEAAGLVSSGPRSRLVTRLDRATDLAQDRGDLAAQEDEGDDRDDRDEGEDQRVLREALAFLVPTKRGEERAKNGHRAGALL